MRSDLGMWSRVEELVDHAPSTQALRVHGLHLFAASQWRATGRPVPNDLREDERRAAMLAIGAPLLLERIRGAYAGRLMVMKGPEVAYYRDPNTRYYRDLDLAADNPGAAQQALVACGFVEGGSPETYEDAQHLRPLAWPGLPLVVEVHRRPNCPEWLSSPSVDELMELAEPSATGVEGLLAPSPAAHALLLAAHSWAHKPLGRLRDLVDVVAVLSHTERRLAEDLARRWGWDGMWATTLAAADAILMDAPRPRWLGLWARHLQPVRERTVIEDHLLRIAAPVCAMPRTRARRSLSIGFGEIASPRPGESWGEKVRRSRLAVAHAFMHQSAHERTLQAQSKEGT
jgi:hypothetical protein